MSVKRKLGISLSGGAVRGMAHLGVLRALAEEDIKPDLLLGTSAGSIVAVLYAAGVSDEQIIEMSRTSRLTRLIKFNWPKLGLLPMVKLQKKMSALMSVDRLEDLPTEVWINVTDLESGKGKLIKEGPILSYVMASCAIPMMFEPQKVGDSWYIDGGVTNNMPTRDLREVCDKVLGVNVVSVPPIEHKDLKGFLPVLDRSLEISLYNRTKANYSHCDIVLEPTDLHQYHKFAFDKSEEIFNEGYEYAKSKMDSIKEALYGVKHQQEVV